MRIIQGDALSVLRTMADESVHCCVTSPPYWGLRDYKLEPLVWGGEEGCGHEWEDEQIARGPAQEQGATSQRKERSNVDAQVHRGVSQGCWCSICGAWRGSLGLEPTPEMYVQHLVEVFREVRRVLRKDGTLWLNLGDSYASQGGAHGGREDNQTGVGAKRTHLAGGGDQNCRMAPSGLKPKDLVGIPWRVAFALQADGWWLRSDIIWHKPNPMPESVTDRPTKSHEYIFLLSKSERYYYSADSIREPHADVSLARAHRNRFGGKYIGTDPKEHGAMKSGHGYGPDGDADIVCHPGGRNKRSVWTVATYPVKDAHFATYPPDLIEPCILAGCPPDGTVLDPFAGAGTTGLVALQHGRRFLGIELNPAYISIAQKRITEKFSLFAQETPP